MTSTSRPIAAIRCATNRTRAREIASTPVTPATLTRIALMSAPPGGPILSVPVVAALFISAGSAARLVRTVGAGCTSDAMFSDAATGPAPNCLRVAASAG